jgi:hypothetical protein
MRNKDEQNILIERKRKFSIVLKEIEKYGYITPSILIEEKEIKKKLIKIKKKKEEDRMNRKKERRDNIKKERQEKLNKYEVGQIINCFKCRKLYNFKEVEINGDLCYNCRYKSITKECPICEKNRYDYKKYKHCYKCHLKC